MTIISAAEAQHTGHPAAIDQTDMQTAVNTNLIDTPNSPDMSDDELDDQSQDEYMSSGDGTSPAQEGVQAEASQNEGSPAGPNTHLPKRRRVSRACDECRRKKVKCDGLNPCKHCRIYSYECTYDKPSNRRRTPGPGYIQALEQRLDRAEALLRQFMPNVDLTDHNLDPVIQKEFRNRQKARAQAQAMTIREEPSQEEGGDEKDDKPGSNHDNEDAKLMSMIESMGQLDLKEGGVWDFHGASSGTMFLQRLKEHFQSLLGNEHGINFLPRPVPPPGLFSIDSPAAIGATPSANSQEAKLEQRFQLPPKDRAKKLCYYSLDCATCLLRVIHQPSFYEMFEKLYTTPQESWGNEEHRFLGLFFAVLALGCVYNVSQVSPSSPAPTYKDALEEGIKYYLSARLILQDVAECRDLCSLQAFVYLILFLQATSHISDCYAFLGIALRSCLRMGLHRHILHDKITPIEDETRRRVFHVVRQMDCYVSAILGFPILLSDEDVDQPLPSEVDDEFITREAIVKPPEGTPSFFQAFNAHNRLMGILARVVKEIYPFRERGRSAKESMSARQGSPTFLISYSRILALEKELEDWRGGLPEFWREGTEGPIEVVRVRTLLRFGFAHVQMMLYRPFLHYMSPALTAGKQVDERCYRCAAKCIEVSRNIIHIGAEIQKQAVLIGPYWFILYAIFFAILSLVFFVLENPGHVNTKQYVKDIYAGREFIANLKGRSLTADRITSALNPLFEQLSERLDTGAKQPKPNRKRSAPPALPQELKVDYHPVASGQESDNSSQQRVEEIIQPQQRGVPQQSTQLSSSSHQQLVSSGNYFLQHASLSTQDFQTLQGMIPVPITGPLTGSTGAVSTNFAAVAATAATVSSTVQDAIIQGYPQHQATQGISPSTTLPQHSTSVPNQVYALASAPTTVALDMGIMYPASNTQNSFVYPAQTHPSTGVAPQPQAQTNPTMQFYPTPAAMQHGSSTAAGTMYDGIEGQLLEPIPSWLMHTQTQNQQEHPGQGSQNDFHISLESMTASRISQGCWGGAEGYR